MHFVTAIVAGAHAHLTAICYALAAWIFVGNIVAKEWQLKPGTSRLKRGLHFFFANLPEIAFKRLNGRTFKLLGFSFPVSIPIFGWSTLDAAIKELQDATTAKITKSPPAAMLLPWLALGALLSSGCIPMPKNATFPQKLQSYVAAGEKIVGDVKAQCGPKFGSFSTTLTNFLNGLANYANPMSDIARAAALVPELKGDYDALACVLRVVEADVQKLKTPAAQAYAARLHCYLARLEQLAARVAELELAPDAAETTRAPIW